MKKNVKMFQNGSRGATSLLIASFFVLIAALLMLDFIPVRYRVIVFLLSVSFSMAVLLITKANLWRYTLALSLIIVSVGMVTSKSMFNSLTQSRSLEYVEYIYIENPNKAIYEPKNVVGFYGVKWNVAKASFAHEDVFDKNAKVDVYADPNTLTFDLLNNHIDGAIVQASFLADILLVDSDFLKNVKIVKRFKIEQAREVVEKPVNINHQPFVLYLSGVDVYGDVLTRARSDMNVVMIVNPVNQEILTISIPRDTYVPLGCEEGAMDKLTHSSLYGVQCSIKTLETLLGIDINYYARINFSGLVNLVDYVGGVSVNSHYDFTTDGGYSFVKGMNDVDGQKALAFARERTHIAYGDLSRGIHHQELIAALLNKMTSSDMITKIPQIAILLQNILDTNLDSKTISSFVADKIDGSSHWTVSNLNLEGQGDMQVVHSLTPQYKYYVYWPDPTSLANIKEQARKRLGGS